MPLLQVYDLPQPPFFGFFRDVVFHLTGCHGTGTLRIGEHKTEIVFYVLHQGKGVQVVGLGFGAGIAVGAARSIESLLFGIEAVDVPS